MKTETLLIIAALGVVAFLVFRRMKAPAAVAAASSAPSMGPVGGILSTVGTTVGGTLTGAASGVASIGTAGLGSAQSLLNTAGGLVGGATKIVSGGASLATKLTTSSLVDPIKQGAGLIKSVGSGFVSAFKSIF